MYLSVNVYLLTWRKIAYKRNLHRPAQGPINGPVYWFFTTLKAPFKRGFAFFICAVDNTYEKHYNEKTNQLIVFRFTKIRQSKFF